jgi:hypothetical protein
MDAAPGISWSPAANRRTILSTSVRESVALALSVSMALVAIFLLSRRLTGGLSTPLSPLLLITVGLIAAAGACSAQLLIQSCNRANVFALSSIVASWLILPVPPVIAIAVSLPGSSSLGLVALWLSVGGTELGLWQLRKNRPVTVAELISGQPQTITSQPIIKSSAIGADEVPVQDHREALTATQKLVYHRAVDGALHVEGWLQARFIAEQRTAIVHVAFCPAFDRAPRVEAELVEGPPAELRPTLVLPWGVRWEIKLDAPATAPTIAKFEFIAHESS